MSEIPKIIAPMFGKPCCRTRVWRFKSLSFGFGAKVYHGRKLVDDYYGEWEMGTYCSSWRIIRDGTIVCGSNDAVDSIDELDAAVKQIEFGRIISITQEPSGIDVRARFDTGIIVDFLPTFSDDDDSFHVFCPNNMCVAYSVGGGWLIEKSTKTGEFVREVEGEKNV